MTFEVLPTARINIMVFYLVTKVRTVWRNMIPLTSQHKTEAPVSSEIMMVITIKPHPREL
jgi:hypothetical protein